MNKEAQGQAPDLETIKQRFPRPKKAVITAGMPYANGPLHVGHLAGAHIPADVYARWMRMLIGPENVIFVNGTDDHGSTSELSALAMGKPIREMLSEIHGQHARTLKAYDVSVDVYTGTSRPECYPTHAATAQEFLRRLWKNGMLEKRVSRQWYDPGLKRFLQDRFVRGKCPNPKCDNEAAYSDECDRCGTHYDPAELTNTKSALSDATPELRETTHLWLDMWKVSETLRTWIESKKGKWRTPVYNEIIYTVLPTTAFANTHEARYKELKASLPKHTSRYAPGKKVALQFHSKADMATGEAALKAAGIDSEPVTGWAHRAITRDVAWGIPVPADTFPDMEGKTLYVWPDSLIAPISFTQVALKARGQDPARYAEFWREPGVRVSQFLGQDNVFFYTLMQGAMWLGTQDDPQSLPGAGDLQLTEIFGCCLLMVSGQKMSKSLGNYYTGDQLITEKGYSADQVRYYLSLLGLPETPSNFDFPAFEERNRFLAGPLNAAFEKPISAVHSKFGGKVPEGVLDPKVLAETNKLVPRYLKAMDRAEYTSLLFAIENYARLINSMFTQYKPHDDRHPEDQRRNALYSCFYVLKTIMIMLQPFVPSTMERVRQTLRLPETVFRVEELGTPIPAGHEIGEKGAYFPAVDGKSGEE